MRRVLTRELTYGRDDLFYHEDQPFTGMGYDLAPEGWVRSEREYRDGSPDGMSRCWYAPGRLEAETMYGGGLFHGLRRTWHENELIASEGWFEHGVCLRRKKWNEDGNITEDFQLQESDPLFKILLVQRQAYEKWKAARKNGEPP